VVNTSNVTQVSIELFENVNDSLQITVDTTDPFSLTDQPDPWGRIFLKIDFGWNSRVCNTGFKANITVPAPLQEVLLHSPGRATVDQINCTSAENQPDFNRGNPPAIRAGRGASLSIGEVVCTLPVAVMLNAEYGQLSISQLHVQKARFSARNPLSSVLVSAGEITQDAYIDSGDGAAMDLNSVTSPCSRIVRGFENPSITGLVSEYLVLDMYDVLRPDLPRGTINTTVTRELCADCREGAWDEAAVMVLGNFTRTGSCFSESAGSCPTDRC